MMTSRERETLGFISAAAEVIEKANSVVLYVHDGVFHADDVLCACLFEAHFKNIERKVIRRRMTLKDIEELKALDDGVTRIVCDTGMEDTIADNLVVLDHHSATKATYQNGVQMAAVGKLAVCLITAFPDTRFDKLYEKFVKSVLEPVEAQDNGQTAESLGIQLSPNLFNWVSSFNCNWNEDPSESSSKFFEAVELATKILDRQLDRLEGAAEAEEAVKECISAADQGVLELDKFMPWQEVVIKHNQENPNSLIKVIVFKAAAGEQWNCQCVPVALGSFDTIVKAPESWGGKTGSEISNLSGIEGATFCHRGLWLCAWKTKNAALKAAHRIIEIYEWNHTQITVG